MHKYHQRLNNWNDAWNLLLLCRLFSVFVFVLRDVSLVKLCRHGHCSEHCSDEPPPECSRSIKSERIQSNKWFELRMKGKVEFGHGINLIVRQMAHGKRFPFFSFIISGWMTVRITYSQSGAQSIHFGLSIIQMAGKSLIILSHEYGHIQHYGMKYEQCLCIECMIVHPYIQAGVNFYLWWNIIKCHSQSSVESVQGHCK